MEWKIFVSIAVFIAIAIHLTASRGLKNNKPLLYLFDNIKHRISLKYFQILAFHRLFLCLFLPGKHDDLGGAHNRGDARAH